MFVYVRVYLKEKSRNKSAHVDLSLNKYPLMFFFIAQSIEREILESGWWSTKVKLNFYFGVYLLEET